MENVYDQCGSKVNDDGVEFSGEFVIGKSKYDGRVILYVIKADQTSYINYVKPLILALELQIPHVISIIDTKDEWYYKIHPERYVPALRDQDPETNQEVIVFESTAYLQYLAERFDTAGPWTGRTAWEKAAVLSWTTYQTAGLGYIPPVNKNNRSLTLVGSRMIHPA